jgi:threonine synthase
MDIQVSSNFERLLFEAHGRDAGAVRRLMANLAQSGAFTIGSKELHVIIEEFGSGATDEAATAATIRETLAATGELLDPHTAVGYAVAKAQAPSAYPLVTLATAHPAKFPDAVEKAAGIRPGLPHRLAHLLEAPERFTVLPNSSEAVRDFIQSKRTA